MSFLLVFRKENKADGTEQRWKPAQSDFKAIATAILP